MTFEQWLEDVLDDRLEYLDTSDKYLLYLEWKEKQKTK